MRCRALGVVTAAVVNVSTPMAAQRGPGAAPAPGPGWLQRQSILDVDQGVPITAAERATVAARLAMIDAEIRRADALARPNAFEAKASFGWDGRGGQFTGRDHVLSYSYLVAATAPTFKLNGADAFRAIRVVVNPYARNLASDQDQPIAEDEDGGEIYLELPPGLPIRGATTAYEYEKEKQPTGPEGISASNGGKVAVLFTAGGVSPWLPVSRERYLRALILQVEGKNQETLKQLRDAASQTPYERWMSGAAQRRKERESAMAMIADKARAAKSLEALEKTEREVTENLKASETKDREFNRRMATNTLGDQFRAQISAMTPAERATTAWMVGGQLVSADEPFARRIVTLNPAFYRTRGSPLEPRAILVFMTTTGYTGEGLVGGQGWPNIDRAVHDVYRMVDWGIFARMLDAQR
jgi:hypothetical protein